RSHFVSPIEGGRVREIELSEAVRLTIPLVARLAILIPGCPQLNQIRLENSLADYPARHEGMSELFVAVYEVEGQVDGYALYRKKARVDSQWSELHLEMLLAATDQAYAGLWRYCLDIDLIERVVAPTRSVDEPLRYLLTDIQAAQTTVASGRWLRLIDVQRALQTRLYQLAGQLRIEVEDEFCSWNSGIYELEVNSAGAATCSKTNAAPDFTLSASSLAACYLGGNRFATLARAGLVREPKPGSLARADLLFASSPLPWCPFGI
ncbi:MAG: sterol carrier protein domain-containing protein, partial [Candidatus Dormibacteraceae bacterium]